MPGCRPDQHYIGQVMPVASPDYRSSRCSKGRETPQATFWEPLTEPLGFKRNTQLEDT